MRENKTVKYKQYIINLVEETSDLDESRPILALEQNLIYVFYE